MSRRDEMPIQGLDPRAVRAVPWAQPIVCAATGREVPARWPHPPPTFAGKVHH
jgi:hypothetical protein